MNLFEKNDNKPLSISKFLLIARQTVEERLPALWVSGEVANFTQAASGHWYFVLRDADGQVDCMMPGRYNALSRTPPNEGEAVEVMAQPSIYTPRGRFQLMVRFMRPAGGAGERYQAFVERKKNWAARGWFDTAQKQALPFLPKTIGIVGSVAGAALHDVLQTLHNRLPAINVIIYPAPAQGTDAAQKIATAIHTAGRRVECEVLIVCRGGGGIEDLWAYNEELVVSAIVNSSIPIVTGIGHETDETLADFAADVRASTPTGAAVAAVPNGAELSVRLRAVVAAFYRQTQREISEHSQRLDWTTITMNKLNAFVATKNTVYQRAVIQFATVTGQYEMACRRQFENAAARLHLPTFSSQKATINNLSHRLLLAAKRRYLIADCVR
jgi:exodeoxyribonuclease VII large subunit